MTLGSEAKEPGPPARTIWSHLVTALRTDVAWIAFWSAPLWSAVFGRVLKHKTPWFVDYHSVACGAQRSLVGQPLYTLNACPHTAMSIYVYPPWVAQVWSLPLRLLGQTGLLIAYTLIFFAAVGFLFWVGFKRRGGGVRRDEAPFLAFTGGNLVVVGNVAVVAQAGLIGAALALGADSTFCLAAIVLASLIKPIYLTYLVLPAFAPAGLARRGALIFAGAGVVLALTGSNLPGVAAWRSFIVQVAVDPNVGGGFLRWLGDAGVHDHTVLTLAYGVYAAVLFGAGLAIAELGGLDRKQRLWLAATFGVLLLPRMIAYDMALLGPGLLAAVRAATLISERAARRLRLVWFCACGINLVSSLIGGRAAFGHTLSVIILVGGLVWLGAALIRRVGPARLLQGRDPPSAVSLGGQFQ